MRRTERMLKTAQTSETSAESAGKVIALPGCFARDAAAFATTTRRTDDGGAK